MPTSVLVFESDPSFAHELESGLARIGCATTVADDANVGLQIAATEKPDLILLTIEWPRMNGFSVCNKLKRDPTLQNVPLIIMSSDSTEETFEQHRRLRGDSAFNSHPVRREALPNPQACGKAQPGSRAAYRDDARKTDVISRGHARSLICAEGVYSSYA